MSLESDLFRNLRPAADQLVKYGFQQTKTGWIYEAGLLNGQFYAEIIVSNKGNVSGKVIDQSTGDEFIQVHIPGKYGAYVASVKEAYLNLLEDIGRKCFIVVPFQGDQANRIAIKIKTLYHEEPDFPWTSEANKDFGVFRNQKNRKWYGLVMHIPYQNFKNQEGNVDVLNVKVKNPDHVIDRITVFPAYHMNKENWISILLDDSFSDEAVMKYIQESRSFTESSVKRDANGNRSWIIPSNPKYWDIISYWENTDESIWNQGRGIALGDTVYMYVGVPYSAIMYKCIVIETDLYYDDYLDRNGRPKRCMRLKIISRYPKDAFDRPLLISYGVTTVRGPRSIPEGLKQEIDQYYDQK